MQSDERLSKLFTRGVDPAFDELVRRYRGPLTVFAGGIVGRDRAEDVVQESLVKAHRSMATDEITEPKAWLYRVVRNTALNEIRDGAKHDHAELTDRAPGRTADQAAEEAERREELAMLISALAELPESQRNALVGRELGGYSHDELAEKLGVSRGATKQLIFRARTGLRNALGALMPMPLIVWLASDVTGTFLASGTGTAAAAGAAGVAGGAGGAAGGAAAGATGAAAGGGLFASLAGGGAAKVAVVAAVAGGTVAAGVAVEERVVSQPETRSAVVQSFDPADPAGGTAGPVALEGESGGQTVAGPEAKRLEAGDRPGDSRVGDDPLTKDSPGSDPSGSGSESGVLPDGVNSDPAAPGLGSGKGFGDRPWKKAGLGKGAGAERPWKEAGHEKPWKQTGSTGNAGGGGRPWKVSGGSGAGADRPWKSSGSGGGGVNRPTYRPPGSGSGGRPFGGSNSGSASSRPARPSRPSSSGSAGAGQASQTAPVTDAPAIRPGGGRFGGSGRPRG